MFDTRLKFEEEEEGKAISSNKDESEPELQVHRNGTQITSGGIQEISSSGPSDDNDGYISDVSTAVNSDCDASDDCSTSYDSEGESEGESESDNDTDDGIYGGSDDTRALLWRHISFFTAPNQTPGLPDVVFAKITIIHTKGEDNRPVE